MVSEVERDIETKYRVGISKSFRIESGWHQGSAPDPFHFDEGHTNE